MARTTAELVGKVCKVKTGADLTPFIDLANLLVTEVCEPLYPGDTDRLEKIETYLSAHFYITMLNPLVSSQTVGKLSQSFKVMVGDFLSATPQGQTAMLYDTQGALAALSKRTSEGAPVPTLTLTHLGESNRCR